MEAQDARDARDGRDGRDGAAAAAAVADARDSQHARPSVHAPASVASAASAASNVPPSVASDSSASAAATTTHGQGQQQQQQPVQQVHHPSQSPSQPPPLPSPAAATAAQAQAPPERAAPGPPSAPAAAPGSSPRPLQPQPQPQPQPPGARATTSTGQTSFRRQRASRACETCHARKVRCDAASLGVPCTNCVAFAIECRIPTPKRKRQARVKAAPDEPAANGAREATRRLSTATATTAPPPPPPSSLATDDDMARTPLFIDARFPDRPAPGGQAPPSLADDHTASPSGSGSTPAPASGGPQFMKPRFARAPIKDAGRVAYLGESSNLSLLVHDRNGSADVVHYPLPDGLRGSRARLTDLDHLEMDILHQRGAFLLPPRGLCDELVEAFFTWVAPVIPIVNRSRFMRRYRDPDNPPSLLLLQAMLLAGTRVCTNPQLLDANGSTTPAAMTFYKRAKALYDANYEDDRVTIVQALVLMSWYWEGPEDVTKNVFYYSRLATTVAQGSGMHRSVESSQLSRTDKRLWKRIWWTLFTRDRSVAVALGRPISINTDDSDVGMIVEDDFVEDEEDDAESAPAEYPPNPIHVHFFLQYVKLCEIMGLVLSQQYSVASKSRRTVMDLQQSDAALADWMRNCPRDLCWEHSRHHFWSALLHSNYYTTLCLLHRAHMPPATSNMGAHPDGAVYPSRTIAFMAAAMITSIVENLQSHDQLRFTPAFIVYSLFSALIMHVYQLRSTVPSIVAASHRRIDICMQGLRDVSRVWLVAKMVHTLFDSILGNKALEERMQGAAGKRHAQMPLHSHQRHLNRHSHHPPLSSSATVTPAHTQRHFHHHHHSSPFAASSPRGAVPSKRKFSDLDIALPTSVSVTPAPPVSYERSRPQTPTQGSPSLGHAGLGGLHSGVGGGSGGGPGTPAATMSGGGHRWPPLAAAQQQQPPHHDAFLGAGTSTPRPTTPSVAPATAFHAGTFSIPSTPPDLFLVTRNSPNLSQSVWENFQPDQLFPDGTNVFGSIGGWSPPSGAVDRAAGIADAKVNPQAEHGNGLGKDARHMTDDGVVDPALPLATAVPPTWVGVVHDGTVPPAHLSNSNPSAGTSAPHPRPPSHGRSRSQTDANGAASGGHGHHWSLGLDDGFGAESHGRGPVYAHDGSEDEWSDGSKGNGACAAEDGADGPMVPLTLNVDDWYAFMTGQ